MIESSTSEYSTMSLFHRCLAGRSRNNPGRLKGVVSCTVSGRPTISLSFGGSSDPQGGLMMWPTRRTKWPVCRACSIVYMDPWEFPPTAHHTNKTDEAGSKDNDYFTEVWNISSLFAWRVDCLIIVICLVSQIFECIPPPVFCFPQYKAALWKKSETKSSLDPVTKKCWRTAYIFFKVQ